MKDTSPQVATPKPPRTRQSRRAAHAVNDNRHQAKRKNNPEAGLVTHQVVAARALAGANSE